MPISVKQRRHHHHEELHFHFLNNTVDDRCIPWYLLSEAIQRRLRNYPEAIQQRLPNHYLHGFIGNIVGFVTRLFRKFFFAFWLRVHVVLAVRLPPLTPPPPQVLLSVLLFVTSPTVHLRVSLLLRIRGLLLKTGILRLYLTPIPPYELITYTLKNDHIH